MAKSALFRTIVGLATAYMLTQIPTAAGAGSFNPVRIRTQPLTMTGVAEPAPTPQADPNFKSVHIRTQPLTMTGVGP